jgi:hypothetical protein
MLSSFCVSFLYMSSCPLSSKIEKLAYVFRNEGSFDFLEDDFIDM